MEKEIIDRATFKPRPGVFQLGPLRIIVSIDDGRWHMSVSCRNRIPEYEEMKTARYLFLPEDIFVGQIFPPKKYFVNAHPYCLHLWQVEETHHFHG